MTTIAHILGDWSRNIGNAFFQLGGLWALQTVKPMARFQIIGEQPGYPSYWNPRGGNPENYFDIVSKLEVDYLVLMGPLFRPETEKIWRRSLERVVAKGTRLIYLGMGMMRYDSETINFARRFLKKFPPYIFTSRDRDTYLALGDLACYTYDGIDFGFFMPDVYSPVGFMKEEKVVALNFDKLPEPNIFLGDGKQCDFKTSYDAMFEFEGDEWCVKFPVLRSRLASKSRYTMLLEGMFFGGNKIKNFGDYFIVRTDHRPHPMLKRKSYRYPNMIINDTPYVYAEVYKTAQLTLSNTVHACVLALAYGNKAMLFSKTQRGRLLERVEMFEITDRPTELDRDLLRKEKQKLLDFLSTHL